MPSKTCCYCTPGPLSPRPGKSSASASASPPFGSAITAFFTRFASSTAAFFTRFASSAISFFTRFFCQLAHGQAVRSVPPGL